MASNVAVAEQVIVNGVDTEGLKGAAQAISEDSTLAPRTFRIRNTWTNGARNSSSISDYLGPGDEVTPHETPFILDADEPIGLFGMDTAANPVESLLHALAACVTTTFVYHASLKGVHIEEIESELEGNLDLRGFMGLDESVRNGFERIRMTIRCKADVPPDRLKALVNLGPQHSPVYDMVTHGVPVDVEIEAL